MLKIKISNAGNAKLAAIIALLIAVQCSNIFAQTPDLERQFPETDKTHKLFYEAGVIETYSVSGKGNATQTERDGLRLRTYDNLLTVPKGAIVRVDAIFHRWGSDFAFVIGLINAKNGKTEPERIFIGPDKFDGNGQLKYGVASIGVANDNLFSKFFYVPEDMTVIAVAGIDSKETADITQEVTVYYPKFFTTEYYDSLNATGKLIHHTRLIIGGLTTNAGANKRGDDTLRSLDSALKRFVPANYAEAMYRTVCFDFGCDTKPVTTFKKKGDWSKAVSQAKTELPGYFPAKYWEAQPLRKSKDVRKDFKLEYNLFRLKKQEKPTDKPNYLFYRLISPFTTMTELGAIYAESGKYDQYEITVQNRPGYADLRNY